MKFQDKKAKNNTRHLDEFADGHRLNIPEDTVDFFGSLIL